MFLICILTFLVPFDKIPIANNTDKIELWVLEAPLLYDKFGPALGFLNLYHMGFGFNNLDTGDKWQLEFDGMPDFVNAVFPSIIKYDNGTADLKWVSSGAAIPFSGINTTYWRSSQWKVAELTGEQHNRYVKEFLANVNKTRAYYDLLDVFDDFPNGHRFISSYTCMDFVWESLDWMIKEVNVKLDYSKKLKRDFTVLHAESEPVVVDFNGPHHDSIVQFYEFLTGKFKNMNLVDFLLELGKLLSGEVYVRQGKNTQYSYVKLKPPYISFKYVYEPMPGQEFHKVDREMMSYIEKQEAIEVEKMGMKLREMGH